MGDDQDFPKPIERCFNRVMNIFPRRECQSCVPSEENKKCPDYHLLEIILPVYRGWNYFNKSCSHDCSENKQKK